MSKNTIQFQEGLSFPNFFASYRTEQQCYQALFNLRWSDGFICPQCRNNTYCKIESRKAFQCHRCHKQTTLTSGTIFADTKLPLTKWFFGYLSVNSTQKRHISPSIEVRNWGEL